MIYRGSTKKSASQNNAGVLMMQQAGVRTVRKITCAAAFRELCRILLDSKLEDDQSIGTLDARPFQAWGLVVGGGGNGGM